MHTKSIALTPKQIEYFWSKVDRSDDPDACWEWQGNRMTNGYGRYSQTLAHRVAFALTNNGLPDELCVCHSCDNRPCCNPAHLWKGTIADNNFDREQKGRGRHPGVFGERNGLAKLNPEKVRQIRIRYAQGGETIYTLAADFNVSFSLISQVVNRVVWRHVA